MHPADFLSQVTQDRQQDRLAAAAVHRLVTELVAQEEHPRQRMLLARKPLKGAAGGPVPPSKVRSALPGGGC
jgi:hypothetical protein